jgi:uncharacterized protein involved in exopolysaccharide biosynthesis
MTTEPRSHAAHSMASIQPKELGMVDVLNALARHKVFLFIMPLLFAVCAALISRTLPDIYMANTKILPREQSQADAAAVLHQLGNLGGTLSIQIPIDPNTKISNDLYISMLKSRSVADSLIQSMDLKKIYHAPSNEAARNILAANSKINLERGGVIAIEVEDADPKRAAKIANAYVDELLKLTKALGLTSASQRRAYIERRLHAAQEKLAAARTALSAHAAAAVNNENSDGHAAVEAVAQLRAEISAKEIELSALQAFSRTGSQEYRRNEQILIGLQNELAKHPLAGAGFDVAKRDKQDTSYANILYDAKYHETLTSLLKKQYNIVKLEETDDSSILEVLDKAVETESPIKPKRAVIILISALFGLCIAVFKILLFDAVRLKQFAS